MFLSLKRYWALTPLATAPKSCEVVSNIFVAQPCARAGEAAARVSIKANALRSTDTVSEKLIRHPWLAISVLSAGRWPGQDFLQTIPGRCCTSLFCHALQQNEDRKREESTMGCVAAGW